MGSLCRTGWTGLSCIPVSYTQSLPMFAPRAWLFCPCSCRCLLQTGGGGGGSGVPRKSSSLKIKCPFLGWC